MVYYYRRGNGSYVFSLEDTTGIRRTVVKDEYSGEQYLRMLTYSKKNLRRVYLDIQEDYRLIKRFFFTPSYWEAKPWQDEFIAR